MLTSRSETKSRVLLVDLARYYGGADVRVLELARSLASIGHPYAVATLEGSALQERLVLEHLEGLPVPFTRSDPSIVSFLRRAIRRHGFDVVDAHNPQSQFWGCFASAWARGVKLVCTVHSAYRLEHQGSMRGRLYEQVLHLNGLAGAQFIAVSEAVASYMLGIGIPQERISLIHNSWRPADQPGSEDRDALLRSFGWNPDVHVVTIVARVEPVKGHAFLLEAFGRAIKDRPQLRCLIIGEGRSRPALERTARNLKLEREVHFTGFRSDISRLLRASDAFCLPSVSEGLPYALLEAASYGLPLVVSRVGGMAALLTHQQNALLVPPADVSALAEALLWTVNHPREAAQLGRAARELVNQRFRPEEMIANTLAVYRHSIGAPVDAKPLAA
jgi:glycosyltransferase involved in cell wall biosynthesis